MPHGQEAITEVLPIPGHPGYTISKDGVVTGPRKIVQHDCSGTKLKYHRVALSHNGVAKKYLVHRLVLSAFKPTNNGNLQARHLDGDIDNNHIDNLEWGTASDNWNDRKRHGRVGWNAERKSTQSFIGNRTLSDEQAGSVRNLRISGHSYTEIASLIGCSKSAVAHIVKGRANASRGYN